MIGHDAFRFAPRAGMPMQWPAFGVAQRKNYISGATRRTVLSDCADRPILVVGTHFPSPAAGRARLAG
jgi:hypothetical protein